jgi:hypothetical protein
METADFYKELISRRAVLIKQYGTLRRCAVKLINRGAVGFDKEHHRYYMRTGDYFRGTGRDRRAAVMLMQLQSMIAEQAMRLLELEQIIP